MKLTTLTRLIGLFFLFLIVVALWHTHLRHFVTLAYIQQHQESLKNLIDTNYATACILYVIFYAAVIVCMLSLTLLITTVAGFLFGTVPATVLSIIGALLGCTLSFLIIRYLIPTWLKERYHTQLEKFTHKFNEHGVLYVLTLYFFPLTPYALITTTAGLSNMPLHTFLGATALGIFPITVLCAFAGKKLATLNSVKEILSTQMILLLSALSLIALLPIIIERIKKNNNH